MRSEEILQQLERQPFLPIRLWFSDGSQIDIRHPEMAIVTRTVISVAIYDSPDSSMPERAVLCDPIHVTRLEPIPDKQPVGS
jgi:hypothetical protein